jgi:hypothetical protein
VKQHHPTGVNHPHAGRGLADPGRGGPQRRHWHQGQAEGGSTLEHQISIWWSQPLSLVCSVNDAVNVLPWSTCGYLNGGPFVTCAAFPGRRWLSGRPQTDMERLVKARFCLVDGMVSRQVGASALTAQWLEASEVVVAGVGGACPGLVVAGRLLGWHDAPGQRGSAGRHTDIRGLGPHVGHTQEGAPGYGRRAQATA